MAVVILPLLVVYRNFYNHLASQPWGSAGEYMGDAFLVEKKDFLYVIVGTIFFALISFALLQRKIFSVPSYFSLLGLYLLLAVASTVFSDHPGISLGGLGENVQPLGVLIAYGVLFYYTFVVVRGEEQVRREMLFFLRRIFVVACGLLGLLGLLQILGFDYMDLGLFGTDKVSIIEMSRIYITLYHPDYVGSLMCLLLPVTFLGVFSEEKLSWKILSGIAGGLGLMSVFGAQARAGIMVVAIQGLFALILALVAGDKKRVILCWLIGLVGFVGLFFLTDRLQGGELVQRFFRSSGAKISKKGFDQIDTSSKNIRFAAEDMTFSLAWEDPKDLKSLEIKDDKGQDLKIEEGECPEGKKQEKASPAKALSEAPYYQIQGCKDLGLRQAYFLDGKEEVRGYFVYDGKRAWFFAKRKGQYLLMNRQGNWDQCISSPGALPDKMNRFASYRGFAWSKTLAKLGETIFIGVGPDQYVFFYPHQDYADRARCKLDTTIYNRPHNWYLQMASETGVISALSILALMIIYFILWFKNRKKYQNNFEKKFSFTCLILIFGYGIISMINDSIVVAAPVFWTVFGLSFALLPDLKMGKKNKSKKVEKKC
ncbi:MAG: O-antigen ligase family protein [Eubacterium sp.]|nr:O-antigen ligase family protein [Eubacterium sp.]